MWDIRVLIRTCNDAGAVWNQAHATTHNIKSHGKVAERLKKVIGNLQDNNKVVVQAKDLRDQASLEFMTVVLRYAAKAAHAQHSRMCSVPICFWSGPSGG